MDGVQPYASLVAFAEDPDLKSIVFATDRATQKFKNISTNNRAALLVENSSNTDADIHDAMAATIIGRAIPATADEKERVSRRYLKKHPTLADFLNGPGCVLVKLNVETYILVENFQQAKIMQMDPF